MSYPDRPAPRRPSRLLALAVLAALPVLGAAASPAAAQRTPAANPCFGPEAAVLLCPDLEMERPFDLALDRRTRPGRLLLRAGNSIDSVGLGPAELRGVRDGPRTMRAWQRIVRRDGSRLSVSTGARLYFKHIPGQGRYWKWRNAARFELWRLNADGTRTLARVGPKAIYCLRDLQRRHPELRRSPRREVYPACNRSARTRKVTLGTSVGWSDVYPAPYWEQWVDVTGLRGRFAMVHIADPFNALHELDEANNRAETVVNLPSGRVEDPPPPGGIEDY